MLNRLQDVFKSFQQHDVKYLVIGGIASILHGVPRATFDMDILIGASPENARPLLDALLEAGPGFQLPPHGRSPFSRCFQLTVICDSGLCTSLNHVQDVGTQSGCHPELAEGSPVRRNAPDWRSFDFAALRSG